MWRLKPRGPRDRCDDVLNLCSAIETFLCSFPFRPTSSSDVFLSCSGTSPNFSLCSVSPPKPDLPPQRCNQEPHRQWKIFCLWWSRLGKSCRTKRTDIFKRPCVGLLSVCVYSCKTEGSRSPCAYNQKIIGKRGLGCVRLKVNHDWPRVHHQQLKALLALPRPKHQMRP